LQRLQIDIGFGDKLTPSSNEILFPTLLSDMDKPLIKCYSVENIIAEKFQAMIAFSTTNSRMKDFYDIYILLKSNNYNNEILHEAIIATFKNRNTSFVVDHDLFTDEFFKDEQRLKMWKSFLIKIKEEKNLSFYEIMILIKEKLYPIWQNL
jgi:hypothetical protein